MFVVHSNWKKYHNRTQILSQKSPKQTKIPNQTIQNNTLAPNSPKRSKPTVHFLRLQYLKQVPHLHFCPLIATVHQSSTDLLYTCINITTVSLLHWCYSPANVEAGTRYSWHGSFSRVYVPHQWSTMAWYRTQLKCVYVQKKSALPCQSTETRAVPLVCFLTKSNTSDMIFQVLIP